MDSGKPSAGRAGGFLTPPQTRDGFRALTMLDCDVHEQRNRAAAVRLMRQIACGLRARAY